MSELIRYVIAGVINTAVGYGAFLALLHGAGFPPASANALSYAAGLLSAFLLNRLMVFEGAKITMGAGLRFALAFGLAFGLNQLVLLTAMAGGVRPEFAQLLAMGSYTVLFYLLNKFFVFGSRNARG